MQIFVGRHVPADSPDPHEPAMVSVTNRQSVNKIVMETMLLKWMVEEVPNKDECLLIIMMPWFVDMVKLVMLHVVEGYRGDNKGKRLYF